jgi:hypothetical protein
MKQDSWLDSQNDDFEAIQIYMTYTRKFSESPPAFHLATYFQTIACIVGRNRYIIQGEDNIYPNIYSLIVAPSSLHKKTSAIKLLPKWLNRLQAMKGFMGQIGSPEGLFSALQDNMGSAVSFYSEAGQLLAQASSRKYMGDILEMLNDLYDCPDFYRKRLSSGPKTANNVCFNLIGASQLDSLTKHVRESDLLSGFLPRFAVVFDDKLQTHMVRRPSPDLKLQNKILGHLNEIRKACQESEPMDLTRDAWDYFESWGNDKYTQAVVAPPQIQPMYGRLEAHALKFCIIIHLSRYPKEAEIDTTSTMAACDYANFVLRSYRRLVLEELTFTVNEQKLKRVTDLIKNHGEIAHREVCNFTRYRKRELDELLQSLVEMGKVKAGKGPKGGKVWRWTDGDTTDDELF